MSEPRRIPRASETTSIACRVSVQQVLAVPAKSPIAKAIARPQPNVNICAAIDHPMCRGVLLSLCE